MLYAYKNLLREAIPLGLATFVSAHALAAGNHDDDEFHNLDALVVTGTRTERIITETPVKTELLLADDLDSYNISNLKDALKLIPTARFENECQNCGLNQIQLLGLSTDHTAILFDGAPLYSGLAKVYGADIFPTSFIDRIEVVKGGSSALYGPEAIAGVVNLITTEPSYNNTQTDISFRSLLGKTSDVEASFATDRVNTEETFNYTVYGMIKDQEGLDLTTDGFTEVPEFHNEVIGAQAWFHPDEASTLKFSYQYMDQSHRGGDSLHLHEEQARVAESLAHELHVMKAGWARNNLSGLDFQLNASYIDIQRISFYGARGDYEQAAYEEAGNTGDVTDAFISANKSAIDAIAHSVWGNTHNNVLYLDAQIDQTWDNHTVSAGAQYRLEKLTDGALYGDGPFTKDEFSNTSVFVQDQWVPSDEWEIVYGARIDDHEKVSDAVLSPRVAFRYKRNEELTYRASWSTGFNAPGAFNEDMHIGVTNGGAIFLNNAADLKEESSQTFSLGTEYRPKSFEDQVILHSQVHFTKLEDSFDIDDSGDLTGDENLWLRVNGPTSEVFVWENNLNWQISDAVQIDSGLSYIHGRFEDPIERVTGLTTREFIERPEWSGHIGVTYENSETVDAHAFLRYTGSMLALGQDADIWRHTPNFWVLDLGLTKKIENVWDKNDLTLNIGIENAFDQRQKDFMDNGEDRDPTYLYGPTKPRTYYLSATLGW